MSYYLALLCSKICCLLPERFCNRLGNILGRLTWYFVPPGRKRMAVDNICQCLGATKQEAQRIAKASWVRFGPMLFEVMRYPVIRPIMSGYVEIEGMEYLRQGLSLGRGAVIATSHSDNWELMGGALALSGVPLVGVAMKQKEAGLDRFINEYRRLVGIHVTYKSSVREMFNMMSEGWAIGLIMDQDTSIHDGIILPVFGRETNCVTGPAALARFRNAPIFPAFIMQKADGRHHLIIKKPIFVERTKNKAADIRRTTQQLMDMLEAHVRCRPEEWFWLHDRWKSIRNRYK